MNWQEKQEVLHYIEKFSHMFNDMMQEVTQRLANQQAHSDWQPFSMQDAAMNDFSSTIQIDPKRFVQQQMAFFEKQQKLWQSASRAFLGERFDPVIEEPKGDKRFSDKDWEGNPAFNYIKQAYLLNAEYMYEFVESLQFDDSKLYEQVKFYTRQFVNSVSPTNYLLTNPEVCREILSTQGENLARGIDNFMRDLKASPSEAFKITQVGIHAFTLGNDLANTEGKVVFENELIQLIQYTPTTQEVYTRPLLIVPPFINKYYILDLNEKKSFVRWLVAQGFTVFMISWVNPDESHDKLTFDDYVFKGVMASMNVIQNITGQNKINAMGYCVGGTLLTMTQAYLTEKGDDRIHSMTLLTTLLDFSEPGEVGNYISRQLLPIVEQTLSKKGYFDGRILALGFSLLRENNLFWSFFIENYLKGKDPMPFDILYWNGDSTNIPGEAFRFYLQKMYVQNQLIEPNAISINGTPIDISCITTPSYCLAAQGDHIVLWQAAYKSAQVLGGEKRFVLTESGHVAGVINPADKGKYPHWVTSNVDEPVKSLADSAQTWLSEASQKPGSWWNDWLAWAAEKSGDTCPAPKNIGSDLHPPLEDAPGRYVKKRLDIFDEFQTQSTPESATTESA